MNDRFISQIFVHTDGDYDLLVLSDGDAIVPARLTPGTAHIQVGRITTREGVGDIEQIVQQASDYIDGRFCEQGQVYLVD